MGPFQQAIPGILLSCCRGLALAICRWRLAFSSRGLSMPWAKRAFPCALRWWAWVPTSFLMRSLPISGRVWGSLWLRQQSILLPVYSCFSCCIGVLAHSMSGVFLLRSGLLVYASGAEGERIHTSLHETGATYACLRRVFAGICSLRALRCLSWRQGFLLRCATLWPPCVSLLACSLCCSSCAIHTYYCLPGQASMYALDRPLRSSTGITWIWR